MESTSESGLIESSFETSLEYACDLSRMNSGNNFSQSASCEYTFNIRRVEKPPLSVVAQA